MVTLFDRSRLGVTTLGIVVVLVSVKLAIHQYGFEFLSLSALVTSAISGAVFILGFLLAGVFGDYKEAEKSPAELRSSLESIWEDAKTFHLAHPEFDLRAVKATLGGIVRDFFSGVEHDCNGKGLKGALQKLGGLSAVFVELEKLGMPANHTARLKTERGVIRKILLRIYHMQRTSFVPSVYFLAESLVVAVIAILLTLKSAGSVESILVFGFLSYLFVYVLRLIHLLEKPFRQGIDTRDDVSLFLIHEFEDEVLVSRETK